MPPESSRAMILQMKKIIMGNVVTKFSIPEFEYEHMSYFFLGSIYWCLETRTNPVSVRIASSQIMVLEYHFPLK